MFAADPIDVDALKRSSCLVHFEHVEQTPSTQDLARSYASIVTSPLPAAFVADFQTHGRGRRGASWWQSPGSLAVSLVFEAQPALSGKAEPIWSLVAGVAVAEALKMLLPSVPVALQWPNDLVVHGRKLGGILVDCVTGGRLIFGIGINTHGTVCAAPHLLAQRVVTIPDLCGAPLARGLLIKTIATRLESLLFASSDAPQIILERYRPLCALEGTRVRVYQDNALLDGLCCGIDSSGSLLLETSTGRIAVRSGSLTNPFDVWHDPSTDSPDASGPQTCVLGE